MNKIAPGAYVDKMISAYLQIPKKKYSTNAKSALELISKFVNEEPSGFSIQFQKQLNSQSCKVTLNRRSIDYYAEGGYLPMTICLLFINSWSKPLKFYSFEFLKLQHGKYKILQELANEYGYDSLSDEQNEILNMHPDIDILFQKLSEDQIRSLVDYANGK